MIDVVVGKNAHIRDRIGIGRIRGLARFRISRNGRVFQFFDHVVPVDNESKDVVTSIEPRSCVEGNVKLRVARIGAFISVSDNTARAMRKQIGMFVGDRRSGTFVAVTVARTALEHEPFINTMNRLTFVVVAVNKTNEMRRGIWRFAVGTEKLNYHFTESRNGAVGSRFRYGKGNLGSLYKGRGQTVDGTRIDKIIRSTLVSVVVRIGFRNRNLGRKSFIERRGVEQLAVFQ